MTADAQLWAIGYDDTDRAEQVRGEVAMLAETHCLNLLDTARGGALPRWVRHARWIAVRGRHKIRRPYDCRLARGPGTGRTATDRISPRGCRAELPHVEYPKKPSSAAMDS
jgi:hypothetical protein